MIPSVNKDERIGDLRLRRLMLNADVSAVATTSRNGLQRRSKVRVNRSAETKYRNVVLIVREEHDTPLLQRGGTLNSKAFRITKNRVRQVEDTPCEQQGRYGHWLPFFFK